jgi:antibiotic biosynthesis monooxygenase (ABM) superfamily enzyme
MLAGPQESFEKIVSAITSPNSHVELEEMEHLHHELDLNETKTSSPPRPTLDSGEVESPKHATTVSIVAKTKLKKPSDAAKYEEILTELAEFCHSNFKGHLYSGVVEHTKTGYITSVHRFDNMENLQRWLKSEDRHRFLKRFNEIVEHSQVDVLEGATQLFDSPDTGTPSAAKKADAPRSPPQWKTVLVIIMTFYPFSLTFAYTLTPKLASMGWKPFQIAAFNYLILLPPAIWIFMPLTFKLCRKWLTSPRPVYPRHSWMFIIDSGLSIFKPVNPDIVNPVQEATINRLSQAESLIGNMQERMRFLEQREKLGIKDIEDMVSSLRKDSKGDEIAEVLTRQIKEDAEAKKTVGQKFGDLPVTIRVALLVPPTHVKTYERFIKDFGNAASQFEGFVGLDVIRPAQLDAKGNGIYVSITRFNTHEQLLKWIGSRERKALLLHIFPFIQFVQSQVAAETVVSFDGFDAFFQNTSSSTNSSDVDPKNIPAPPPKWKTSLLTYAILYALSQLFGAYISPNYSKVLPLALTTLVTLTMIVITSSYIVTPFLNKVLQDWLHGYTMAEIPQTKCRRCLHFGIPGL